MEDFLRNRWIEKANKETGSSNSWSDESILPESEEMQRWNRVSSGEVGISFESRRHQQESLETFLEIIAWKSDPEIGRLLALLQRKIGEYITAADSVHSALIASRNSSRERVVNLGVAAERRREEAHNEIVKIVEDLGKAAQLGAKWLKRIGNINAPKEFRDGVRTWAFDIYPEICKRSMSEEKTARPRKQFA